MRYQLLSRQTAELSNFLVFGSFVCSNPDIAPFKLKFNEPKQHYAIIFPRLPKTNLKPQKNEEKATQTNRSKSVNAESIIMNPMIFNAESQFYADDYEKNCADMSFLGSALFQP